ncbi:hypothetical protein JOF53_000679 [Crossiella equi]|uniref:MmyB-like transcription regulator ligand binding domain-containing protein n=1 Tax=Crossiella equi TaxID=130796 RepID=A0ABS5A6D0_9PSEU|nr:hypothetical protein [Crossiella equi]
MARNAVLVAVLGHEMAPGTSFARYLFTEPAARARIANWPDIAAAAVGGLS